MNKKIYIVGIGGIGISAIARYYNEHGYSVFGSDSTDSELIQKLKTEGIDIIIGAESNRIDESFDLVVYTEAISEDHRELRKAGSLNIKTFTYPQALARIANTKNLIAVAGTHGKSTTTSLCSIMMKNSKLGVNSVVGTLLNEFGGKNSHFSNSKYFVIEACEYKRSFLHYTPLIGIITNIEIDHLDYYKDLADYISAYKEFIDNIKSGGYIIINGDDDNCKKLIGIRNDISYIVVHKNHYNYYGQDIKFPNIDMQIPGDHILFDAHITYVLGQIIGLENKQITSSLEGYSGIWRRMEYIGQTEKGNILLSDYGHHPTEIKFTLDSVKQKYIDKEIVTIFQPHQYNRTIELLEGFKDSFGNTDILIIPNIYESRDTPEDISKMSTDILLDNIIHGHKINGESLIKTESIIKKIDGQKSNYIFLLLGAGDVDNLRYKIKTS